MPVDPDTGIPVNDPSYVDQPCGPKDWEARFPEPAHFDCRECHRLIREHLSRRGPVPFPQKRKVQLDGPWMDIED